MIKRRTKQWSFFDRRKGKCFGWKGEGEGVTQTMTGLGRAQKRAVGKLKAPAHIKDNYLTCGHKTYRSPAPP
uniref:Uncharacterized protein n=1 Tax=Knipowitschia caucasica TaxID=637954 RepID=A0AAV2K8E3_KNICA